MKKHLIYIDGLKGFSALMVIILHYLLAFDVQGYIGWNCGIAEAEKWNHYWTNFPLSAFTNASYVLYMFFAIIAFLPAHVLFNGKETQWIQKQAIIRYFRFVPYTFILILISYILFSNGLYFNQELGKLLQEPWNNAIMSQNMLLSDVLWSGLIGAMMVGAGNYLTSLWCMNIIFIGSYLSYAVLLFSANVKNRIFIYIFLWLALYTTPLYSFFITGIAVADIYSTKKLSLSTIQCRIFFAVGLICAIIGEAPWSTLSIEYIPARFIQYFLQNFGIFSILLAICKSKALQNFFNNKIFLHCSKYCFEYIIVHALILFSFSAWVFIQIYDIWGYTMAFIVACITAIPLNIFATVACAKVLQPLTTWLSSKAYAFFTKVS